MRRAGRVALRWFVGFLLLTMVAWVGTTLWAKYEMGAGDVPFGQLMGLVATTVGNQIWCAATGCPIEAPEGMNVVEFATAELAIATPVAIDVDEWGRVYVAESPRVNGGGVEDNRFNEYWLLDDLASRSVEDRRAYYEKWMADPDADTVAPGHFTGAADHIVLLEDTDGDGLADRRQELADFGDIVDGPAAGVMVRDGELWATTIPGVYRMRDTDGDRVPDALETLSTGWGVKTSLMGHDLHGLVQGPDGKIYFSVGDRGYNVVSQEGRHFVPPMGPGRGAVFRMNPDGSALERFCDGVRNPQELAFDDYGNLFTGDNNGDGGDQARVVYLVEGGDTGWAMPFQTLVDDYVRGPWVAERLWETAHESQPAWIVPPIAYLGSGPAGFAHYPGTGLPERYAGHFLMADYRYQAGLSGIHAFAVEPDGAGFRMVDDHLLIGNILPTDLAFGYDGRLFVSHFDQFMTTQRILAFRHSGTAADSRADEVARLVQEGMAGRDADELVALLGHPDRRVRQRSQFELARRGDPAPLAALLRATEAPLIPRLHALWALGQQGRERWVAAVGSDPGWIADVELEAQVAKLAGELGASELEPALLAWLEHASARVRFFAAQSLGKLGSRAAVAPLYALLEANADADVFLRHSVVYALHNIADVDTALARAEHPSRAVRLGVLLQLRRAAHPAIARFLTAPEPALVVEAARAIYDVPIPEAMPALAALAGTALVYRDDDPQTSHALHRRVIGAARHQGTEAAALALAAHAADAANPRAMRALALETLGEFTRPGPRDLTNGFHRPLPERDRSVVHAALDRHGPALIAGDLGDRALEIATAYGRIPLSNRELAALAADGSASPERRVAALEALASREDADAATLDQALRAALADREAALRIVARSLLAERAPSDVLASIGALESDAPLAERQAAWSQLARIGGPVAVGRARAGLDALAAGTLPRDEELDLFEAVAALGDASLDAQLAAQRALDEGDLLAERRFALAGGDPAAGRRVFQAAGDCQRCHGAGGHGAGAGPGLGGVAARGAEYLLESVILPQARIAEGYATVGVTLADGSSVFGTLVEESPEALVLEASGERVRVARGEIASQTPPASGMPPMGLALSPRDLRDLIAYVSTL